MRWLALAALCAVVCALTSGLSADDSSQLVFSSLFGNAAPGEIPARFRFIALGPDGTIYLSGQAPAYQAGAGTAGTFPITPNALQPNPPAVGNPEIFGNAFLAVIDPSRQGQPQLVYSTYFGTAVPGRFGPINDAITGLAVDKAGRFYICGSTGSTAFPVTRGALQTRNLYAANAIRKRIGYYPYSGFFAVIDPSRSGSGQLVYSTYLSGEQGPSYPEGVAVDDRGLAYIAGFTGAGDFPVRNAFQPQDRLFHGDFTQSNTSAFAVVIDPARSGPSSLVYSTFLAGSIGAHNSQGDAGMAIAAGPGGLIYVTGSTSDVDFPTSAHAFQKRIVLSTVVGDPTNEFLTVLNPARPGPSQLVYSTYLGGNSGSSGNSLAVDAAGNAYITGGVTFATGTDPFPVTPNALQPSNGLENITKINPFANGKASLVYSSLFGAESPPAGFIFGGTAVDSRGFLYLVGGVGDPSEFQFPITPDAFQTALEPNKDFPGLNASGFLMILDPLAASASESVLYSTFFGAGGGYPQSVSVDPAGRAYIAGSGSASDIPLTANSYESTGGSTFAAILNPPVPSDAPTATATPTPKPTPTIPRL